jgi:outer membrane protein OmpA-like peptidoglycan-associated protein
MHLAVCAMWAVFLGASLACFLVWLSLRPGVKTQPLNHHADKWNTPSILWLDPWSRAALRTCADPARLRRMSIDKLAEIVGRAAHPAEVNPPTPVQYSTWPIQAELIYRGDFQGLRDWQAGWKPDSKSEIEPTIPVSSPSAHFSAPLFVGGLILLMFAILAFVAASVSGACDCTYPATPSLTTPPTPPTPPTFTFDLPTDTLFDYNRSAPYGPAQEALLSLQLSGLFSRFTGIAVTNIDAHTDPIGDSNGNKALGIARAQSVLDRIHTLMQKPSLRSHFATQDLPKAPLNPGPNQQDGLIWHDCFDAFQVKQDPRFKPLEDLDSEHNPEGRPPCRTARSSSLNPSAFPACRAPYQAYFVKDNIIRPNQDVFDNKISIGKAENFRELTSCLAPMRHVVIVFTYTGQVAIPNTPSANHTQSVP